jgi:type VI protein secretion system component Hcp
MFAMNLRRRFRRDNVPAKDEASRSRLVRARRNFVGVEPLEERQLLSAKIYMLIGDGTFPKGSATAANVPKGAFEVSSFVWGVSNPATIGGPGHGSNVSAPNFSITKSLDSASTGLFFACTLGTLFETAEVLVLQRSGANGKEVKILEYDFSNLLVTSAVLSDDSGADLPTESDSFSFTAVQIHYTAPPSPGERIGIQYITSWNFANSSPTFPANTPVVVSTSTAGTGASKSLKKTADVHAAPKVNHSHKAEAAGLKNRLASRRSLEPTTRS